MAYGARRRPPDGIHRVQQGETVSSIAATYGITDWESAVWNAGENAALQQQRVNPNTLEPGDQVFIPELREKQEERPTDEWHDFHVVRNRRFLRIKLRDEEGKPLAGKTYELVAQSSFRGTFTQQGTATDADGMLEEQIPHTMTQADLRIPECHLHTRLKIGHLRPLPNDGPVRIGAGGTDIGGAMGQAGDSAGGLLDSASGAGGGLPGGIGGGIGSVIDSARGALGGVQQGAQQAFDAIAPAVSAAAPLLNAVGSFLGQDALVSVEDQNIYPAAQRLESLGFDPGDPTSDTPSARFTAALVAFQTWSRQQGLLDEGAGGLLGAAGGLLGATMASKVGLSGNLDEQTIDALKTAHGC